MANDTILGIGDFGNIDGTPLLPPSYLTVYFSVYTIFLCLLYLYFSHRRQPVILWHKFRLILVIASVLKITLLVGVLVLAFYWLVPAPTIRRTVPAVGSNSASLTGKIEIVFDKPVARSSLVKSISPDVPGRWVFEDSIYTTHLYRRLVFYPTYSLSPDTTYEISLEGIENMIKASKPYDYKFAFRTSQAPKLITVEPQNGASDVAEDIDVKVTLDAPSSIATEFDFTFEPSLEFSVYLKKDRKSYSIIPKKGFEKGVEYRLRIRKTDLVVNLEEKRVVERGSTEVVYEGTFSTRTNPGQEIKTLKSREPLTILDTAPQNDWTGVSVNSNITIAFDRKVNQKSAENNFSMEPNTVGIFRWDENDLVFDPTEPLEFSTDYKVKVAKGVTSPEGQPLFGDFEFAFRSQDATVKLPVPAILQKYSLSCELASLRMTLLYRGINESEETLLSEVGVDNTPHNENTWGDPYEKFVGNVNGKQMADGYGVYWDPIARVGGKYRNTKVLTNSNISELTKEIAAGNPVITWVYSKYGSRTSWNTPFGKNIYAVRDEHAVVAVGFVGPPDNPTQVIVNDPLVGQVYWPRSLFDKKWKIFENSGVIVY